MLIEDRIKGLLIGGAYGDALGMPTEMMSRNNLKELFPNGVTALAASTKYDFIGREMKAGEVTDDTINTLLICEMIIQEKGNVSTETYLSFLQQWMKDNPTKSKFVAGPSTIRALEAIKNGVPIEKAGIFGTTNGSAMKIGPVGIISDYRLMEELVDNVERICLPTHNTSIAVAGASVIAACVSYVLRSETFEINHFWSIALEAARVGATRGFEFPSARLSDRIELVYQYYKEYSEDEMINYLKFLFGTGVETIETIPAVLAIVSISKGDPIKAGIIGASIGGDTDTIASIACGICGCINQNFQNKDIMLLEEVNDIDFTHLSNALSEFFK